jgi:hypothetical protein
MRVVIVASLVLMSTLASCSTRPEIMGLNPACKAPPDATPVSCEEAVLVGQAVARSNHVWTHWPRAEVKPEAIAKGRSVPAWWVTFEHVEYRDPSGVTCAPPSYAVIVDAATGQLLAFDDPSPNC